MSSAQRLVTSTFRRPYQNPVLWRLNVSCIRLDTVTCIWFKLPEVRTWHQGQFWTYQGKIRSVYTYLFIARSHVCCTSCTLAKYTNIGSANLKSWDILRQRLNKIWGMFQFYTSVPCIYSISSVLLVIYRCLPRIMSDKRGYEISYLHGFSLPP